ncbi:Uncharacterized protein XB16_2276 [Leptospira santarosai]|uniref:Uncharacterized protein n=1 Tax=Leptospira santarosai TaxID=28183 RepID=A0A2P1QUL8_9LEPT|nr:Uncharacterized protein XB16_2276 [Leptospira santarosai]
MQKFDFKIAAFGFYRDSQNVICGNSHILFLRKNDVLKKFLTPNSHQAGTACLEALSNLIKLALAIATLSK